MFDLLGKFESIIAITSMDANLASELCPDLRKRYR